MLIKLQVKKETFSNNDFIDFEEIKNKNYVIDNYIWDIWIKYEIIIIK